MTDFIEHIPDLNINVEEYLKLWEIKYFKQELLQGQVTLLVILYDQG